MSKKRIGILTGGGDVPGLNSVIKNVTLRAEQDGFEIFGIKRGWGGLIYMDPNGKGDDSEHLVKLDKNFVRKIDRTGGTILRSSRTRPSNASAHPDLEKYRGIKLTKKTDMTEDVIKNIKRLGLDCLIAIGGDDTLSYGVELGKVNINVIGVPKTMDNDVNGTEYCIGFSSCVSKSMHMINDLRTSMGSHERFGVIELFGRNAGFTSLYASYVTGGNMCLIPEHDFDPDKMCSLLLEEREKNPSKYAMVLISEGAKSIGGEIIESGTPDAYGHKKLGGISNQVSEFLTKETGYKTIVQNLGYFMRSGSPDAIDQMVASFWGNLAVDCYFEGQFGILMAIAGGRYATVPLSSVTAAKRIVDVKRFYNTERYVPKYENVRGLPLFLS